MARRDTESSRAVAELEAHDNLDITVSEELFEVGCPLCRHRVAQGRRFLHSLVYEGVNDVGFRRVLEQSHGFCGHHAVALYEADREEMGGALGAAILLESVLRHRLEELAGANAEPSRAGRQRLERAAAAPECPPAPPRTTASSRRSSGCSCAWTASAGARLSPGQRCALRMWCAWPARRRWMRRGWQVFGPSWNAS